MYSVFPYIHSKHIQPSIPEDSVLQIQDLLCIVLQMKNFQPLYLQLGQLNTYPLGIL